MHPFSQEREIAGRERVRRGLGLTAQQEHEHTVAREIAAGEVRIEAAVLDPVPLVMPRLRRTVEQRGLGEREVEK